MWLVLPCVACPVSPQDRKHAAMTSCLGRSSPPGTPPPIAADPQSWRQWVLAWELSAIAKSAQSSPPSPLISLAPPKRSQRCLTLDSPRSHCRSSLIPPSAAHALCQLRRKPKRREARRFDFPHDHARGQLQYGRRIRESERRRRERVYRTRESQAATAHLCALLPFGGEGEKVFPRSAGLNLS